MDHWSEREDPSEDRIKVMFLKELIYAVISADQKFLRYGNKEKFREILYELFEIFKIIRDLDTIRVSPKDRSAEFERAKAKFEKVKLQLKES